KRLNDNLAYKVKHSVNISINKKWEKLSINLNGRYKSAIEEVFIYPGNEPDAFSVLNGRISYKMDDKKSLYLSVQNITDARYEELERYRMPGRAISIGARIEL
ncbi:MAG: hypothetical protein V3V14_14815, partial [Saprospiraceae bacterium]